MQPFLLLASVILLAAAPPLPGVPVYRQFGRWLVACDNTRTCVARGFDEGIRAELELTRSAGGTAPTLTLSAADPVDAAAIRLDGKPLAFPAPAWSDQDLPDARLIRCGVVTRRLPPCRLL